MEVITHLCFVERPRQGNGVQKFKACMVVVTSMVVVTMMTMVSVVAVMTGVPVMSVRWRTTCCVNCLRAPQIQPSAGQE